MKFKELSDARKDFFNKQMKNHPELVPLRDKLLKIDGLEIVPRLEGDLSKLLMHGYLFDFDAELRIMGTSRCHQNAVKLWMENKEKNKICTGWGLSDDGLWRQHTWIISNEKIIETTEIRIKYFGLVFNDEEAEMFALYNMM